MKRPFQVGDWVRVYGAEIPEVKGEFVSGLVEEVFDTMVVIKLDVQFTKVFKYYRAHIKQCRRLRPRKKPPEPSKFGADSYYKSQEEFDFAKKLREKYTELYPPKPERVKMCFKHLEATKKDWFMEDVVDRKDCPKCQDSPKPTPRRWGFYQRIGEDKPWAAKGIKPDADLSEHESGKWIEVQEVLPPETSGA